MGISPSKQNDEGQEETDTVKEVDSVRPGTAMSEVRAEDTASQQPQSVAKAEIGESSSGSESVTTKSQSQCVLSEDTVIDVDVDSNIAMYTDVKMRRRFRTQPLVKTQRRSPRALSPLSISSCSSRQSRSQSGNRKRAESRRVTRQMNPKPTLGELGYTFVKYFDGHGWYTGRVVKIRFGAANDKSRRVAYEDGDVEDLSLRQLRMIQEKMHKFRMQPKATANIPIVQEGLEDDESSEDDVSGQSSSESDHVDLYQLLETATRCKGYVGSATVETNGENDQHRGTFSDGMGAEVGDSQSSSTGAGSASRRSKRTRKIPLKWREDFVIQGSGKRQTQPETNDSSESSSSVSRVKSESSKTKQKSSEISKSNSSVSSARSNPIRTRSTSPKPSGTDAIANRSRQPKRKNDTIDTSDSDSSYDNTFRTKKSARIINSDSESSSESDCTYDGTSEKVSPQTHCIDYDPFANADEFMPIDNAAEATLQNEEDQGKGSEGSDDSSYDPEARDWYSKTAAMLAGSKSKKGESDRDSGARSPSRQSSLSGSGCVNSPNRNEKSSELPTPASIAVHTPIIVASKPDRATKVVNRDEGPNGKAFYPLKKIKQAKRYGLKVINMNESILIVGEVMVVSSGWVEVAVSGELVKARVGNYVVVPDHYSTGNEMNKDAVLMEIDSANNTSSDKRTPPARKKKPTTNSLSFDSLFYWCCDSCCHVNKFTSLNCMKCHKERDLDCKPSALLNIAEEAVKVSPNLEEALRYITNTHHVFIPHEVLKFLLKRNKNIAVDTEVEIPPVRDLSSLFFWNCAFCTMKNSYNCWTCNACSEKFIDGATECSTLLKIAREAARDARSVEDALSLVPVEHVPAIPEEIMNSLVTCIAETKGRRRCLRPKLPGLDYCTIHCAPALLTGKKNTVQEKVDVDRSVEEQKRKISTIKDEVFTFLRTEISSHQINSRSWNVRCIEDSMLCQNQAPFPLGLRVRKFFPGYGFHDGSITCIDRKSVGDEQGLRPMLVYQVCYNDSDGEDLLHHEINSLRQIYDRCNVNAIAAIDQQLKRGTVYATHVGFVEIIRVDVKLSDKSDEGTVVTKFTKTLTDPGKEYKIPLTKLQLTVLRKIEAGKTGQTSFPSSPPFEMQTLFDQICEVESGKNKTNVDTSKKDNGLNLMTGLTLHRRPIPFKLEEVEDDLLSSESDSDSSMNVSPKNVPSSNLCCRPDVVKSGWTAGWKHVLWDPFGHIKCSVCKKGENEHHILVCDSCSAGFHMYCLRPVVVNIPKGEWLCPNCTKDGEHATTFGEIIIELEHDFNRVSSYLFLPFNDPAHFFEMNKEALSILGPDKVKEKRSAFGTAKSRSLIKKGDLYITRNTDRKLWILPTPLFDESELRFSLTTLCAAMSYCGMNVYSESLVYSQQTAEMNDSSLEKIESLSKKNIEIFISFKENLKRGLYPPIEVVYNDDIGFTVKALATMAKFTLIAEYVGEVVTVEESSDICSDSLMMLLDTGEPSTSLIIDPTKKGNYARFLSGINNRSILSKRRANVRTLRFSIDNKCRVALFTSKQVSPGEVLHYDYNAGMEGKTDSEWAQSGFYDTSNFI